jgi:glycosyltransferase involved in cell wall biosynthesis
MKVIHILIELKFSGAEIMYVDAASIFQNMGCELTVMATAKELGEYAPYFERAGYQIIHQPIPPLKKYLDRIKFYRTIIKLLKKEQFDVVHIHSPNAMWGMALCAWLANAKSVFTFHNVFPTRFFTYPYHCLLRWSAKTIFKCKFHTISDSVYDHELKLYYNNTNKIYNWYRASRFFPAIEGEKEKARNELGISSETLVVISIGGCSSVKRHSDIINALPIVLQAVPDCMYLHLGKGGTELDEIQLVKKLGLDTNVRFCDNQADVRKYLIASDIYLMTSRFEGISLTSIEAMACEIPTILYDVPGLRDFNKEEENCILIAEDYHLLAEKIISLKTVSVEATEMVIRAKSFVNSQFSMESNSAKIFELYN